MSEHAFPANHFDLADNEHGMTLRDYFAASAITGLLAAYKNPSVTEQMVAMLAYKLADAMLKERRDV